MTENELKICEPGLEEYPVLNVVRGNLTILSWIATGALAVWLFYPLAAWVYLSFALVMIVFVLRKLLCANCYYYGKRCSMGWGKFSALLFKKGALENFSKGPGQSIAIVTYDILSFVPLILLIVSLVKDFTLFKVFVLALLVFVSFYGARITRRDLCSRCKMRLICKLSAA